MGFHYIIEILLFFFKIIRSNAYACWYTSILKSSMAIKQFVSFTVLLNLLDYVF